MDLYLAGGGQYTPGPLSIGEAVLLSAIAFVYVTIVIVIIRSDKYRR